MPYVVAYYHFIWATYQRTPTITPEIEPVLYDSIRYKSDKLACPIMAMNSTPDHIHVAVSLSPQIAPADWVKNVKGRSSRIISEQFPDTDEVFKWQRSYRMLTFGRKQVPFVVKYIQDQKIHHATGKDLIPYMERIDD